MNVRIEFNMDTPSLREANHHRKFIRNRKVPHGGSTWDGYPNCAYVPTSEGKPRFAVLLILRYQLVWLVYILTLIGYPPT